MLKPSAPVCFGLILASAPAFSQSHTYTNADLGKPLPRTHAVNPSELEWLLAHQYVYVPEADGPTVTFVDSRGADQGELNAPLEPMWEPAPLGVPYGYGWYGGYGPYGSLEHGPYAPGPYAHYRGTRPYRAFGGRLHNGPRAMLYRSTPPGSFALPTPPPAAAGNARAHVPATQPGARVRPPLLPRSRR